MKLKYQIDLQQYSLQKFKRDLRTRQMIPSRLILKDDIESRFKALEDQGITNLKELIDALGTKDKIATFSQASGLTSEYLTLIKREARSYQSNPVRLDKLPGVQQEYLHKLGEAGIKNTRQLFNTAWGETEREQLAHNCGIPSDILDELISLSDLSRVYGVGPVFARMIYDVGITSLKEFITYSAEDFIRIYEDQTKKKADFGINEIQFSLQLARELERV